MKPNLNLFFLGAGLLAVLLSACDNTMLSPDQASAILAEMPASVELVLDSQYPGLEVVKIETKYHPDGSIRKYEVFLSNGQQVNFDAQGQLISEDASGNQDDSIDIPVAELPANIPTYLAEHYPGQGIKKAKKRLNDAQQIRSYEVRLTSKVKVFFDAHGNFLREED